MLGIPTSMNLDTVTVQKEQLEMLSKNIFMLLTIDRTGTTDLIACADRQFEIDIQSEDFSRGFSYAVSLLMNVRGIPEFMVCDKASHVAKFLGCIYRGANIQKLVRKYEDKI